MTVARRLNICQFRTTDLRHTEKFDKTNSCFIILPLNLFCTNIRRELGMTARFNFLASEVNIVNTDERDKFIYDDTSWSSYNSPSLI